MRLPPFLVGKRVSERMFRRELRVLTLARIPAIPENKDDYGNIAPPESSAERSSP